MLEGGINVRVHKKSMIWSFCWFFDGHEIFLVINCYLMSLSLNFHQDWTIRLGDIKFFVTIMYNLKKKSDFKIHFRCFKAILDHVFLGGFFKGTGLVGPDP